MATTTIWKYPILTTDWQEIHIPRGADILTVQVQHGDACLWARVNPAQPPESRMIEVFGTGHEIHKDMGVERRYIGTYQLANGDLVFHVFERL